MRVSVKNLILKRNFNYFLYLILIIFLISEQCYAHFQPEKKYQKEWCDKFNGLIEYQLPDKTRVDCLTKNYAVEFDFANKWAESIGQSLYYGLMTNKKPAVVLIIEKPEDFKYYKRIEKVAKFVNFRLWYVKSPQYNNKF